MLVQQTDFADATEAEQLLARLQQVIGAFDDHAYHEDNFILPAIQQLEPGLKDLFEQEHEEDHALGQRLTILIKAFPHAVSAGPQLNHGFSQFNHKPLQQAVHYR